MRAVRLPKTKAKNAFELLQEIRLLILAVPTRYNQMDILSHYYNTGEESSTGQLVPACGTIGCRAGWVAELTSNRPNRLKDVLGYAQKKLGLTNNQADGFFSGFVATGRGGTREHARSGARGITKFLRENRRQLKAKLL